MGILDISHGKYFTDEAIYEPLYKLHKYELLVKKICGEDSPFDRIEKKNHITKLQILESLL